MGRRSQHTPDELRELILSSTRRVVEEMGYTDLSAREIARAIDYAPGTLYNMFTNLDDILLKVEVRVLDEMDAAIADAMAGRKGADAIRHFALTYVEFGYRHHRLWELIQHHHPKASASLDWYHERLYAPLGRLEDVLGKMSGIGDAEDVTRMARLIWASVHGILQVATTAKFGPVPQPTTVSMVEAMIAALLASGVAPRASRRDDGRRTDPRSCDQPAR